MYGSIPFIAEANELCSTVFVYAQATREGFVINHEECVLWANASF